MHYVSDAKATPFNHSQNASEQETISGQNTSTAVSGSHWNVFSTSESMFLTVPVTIESRNKIIDTYAMLDYRSAFTLIDKDFA